MLRGHIDKDKTGTSSIGHPNFAQEQVPLNNLYYL